MKSIYAGALSLYLVAAPLAQAAGLPLSYGGRLTDGSGKPVDGPVKLELQFYRQAKGGEPVLDAPVTYASVTLAGGVFQVPLGLSTAAFQTVFPDVATPVFVEVTDATHKVTYPRQQFLMVPFAARVPVDGATITVDGSGNLTLTNPPGTGAHATVQLDASSRLPAVDGSQLTNVPAASVGGLSAATVAAAATAATNATSSNAPGTLVARDGTGSFAGGTLTADQAVKIKGGAGYVTLKAAAGSGTTYTLPAAPTSGFFLTTDNAGNLSWVNTPGGGDMLASTWTSGGYLAPDKGGLGADVSAASGVPAFATGSLAFLTVGSAANDLVQLDGSSRLPAVNGSQLTALNASALATGTLGAGGPVAVATSGGVSLKGTGSAATTLKLFDKTSANFVGLKAGDGQSSNVTFTLPAADGSNGQVLTTTGTGTLAFSTVNLGSGSVGGVLPVTAGGTGVGVLPNNGVLIGGGTTLTSLSGTANQVLVAGAGGVPTFTTLGDANLAANAAIARSKLAADAPAANYVLVNDGSGNVSSEAQVTVAQGGTGLASLGSAAQLLGVNAGGTGLEYKTVQGTAHQITVTAAAGSLTVAAPQNLDAAASPQFTGLTVSGLASSLLKTNGSGVVGAAGASDVTSALGYAPVNRAGDTMSGALNLPTDGLNVGSGELVTTGGTVGIGTTSTAATLDVNGTVRGRNGPNGFSGFVWGNAVDPANPLLSVGWPGSTTKTSYVKASDGDNLSLGIGAATTGSGNLRFFAGSGGIYFSTSSGQQAVLTNAGNLGIGTSTPSYLLDVNGTIHGASLAVGTLSVTTTVSSPGAGTPSEHFGAGSVAGGNYSAAFGGSASSGGQQSSAFGYNANANYTNTAAFGYNASTGGASASAFGSATTASGGAATAIGSFETASGANATALGTGGTASGPNSIAIGTSAQATASDSIAVGALTSSTYNQSIALGRNAVTTAGNQLVVGASAAPIYDVYAGKGVSDAAPVPWTLHGTSGSGAGVTGGDLILAAGTGGTTADNGGALVVRTSAAGTGTLAERLRVQPNGNVGIGTTSSAYKLDIAAGAAPVMRAAWTNTSTNITSGLGYQISLQNTSATPGNYSGLWFHDAAGNPQGSIGMVYGAHTGVDQGTFYIEPRIVASPSSFVVAPSGFVGIGVTSPNEFVHMEKDQAGATVLLLANNNGTSGARSMMRLQGTGTSSGNQLISFLDSGVLEWTAGQDVADGNKFKIAASGALNMNTYLTIASAGQVGIGSASPGTTLDVAGQIRSSSTITSNTTGSATSVNYNFGTTIGNTGMFAPAANVVAFATNGGERLRIDQNGSVGIGTTSPVASLDVESSLATGNAPFLWLGNSSGATPNTFGPGLVLTNGVAGKHGFVLDLVQSADSRFSIADQVSPYTEYLTISQSGNVGIGTASPTTALDVVGGIKSTKWKVTQSTNNVACGSSTGSFTSGGGTVLMFASGSGYCAGSGCLLKYAIQVDGATYGYMQEYINEPGSHRAVIANGIVISGLAAGSHNVGFTLVTGVCDTNDYFNATELELPF